MRHFSPAIPVEAHALTDEAALTARKRGAVSEATPIVATSCGLGLTREQWAKQAVIEGTHWRAIGQTVLGLMTIVGVFDAFQKLCEEAGAKRANARKPKGGATADNQRSEKEEKEQRTQAGILIKLAKRSGLSLPHTGRRWLFGHQGQGAP